MTTPLYALDNSKEPKWGSGTNQEQIFSPHSRFRSPWAGTTGISRQYPKAGWKPSHSAP